MPTTPTAIPDDATHLLTRDEAATIARVSRRTIDRTIGSGQLPATRIGRRVLISRAALEAWLAGLSDTPTAGPLAGRRL